MPRSFANPPNRRLPDSIFALSGSRFLCPLARFHFDFAPVRGAGRGLLFRPSRPFVCAFVRSSRKSSHIRCGHVGQIPTLRTESEQARRFVG